MCPAYTILSTESKARLDLRGYSLLNAAFGFGPQYFLPFVRHNFLARHLVHDSFILGVPLFWALLCDTETCFSLGFYFFSKSLSAVWMCEQS